MISSCLNNMLSESEITFDQLNTFAAMSVGHRDWIATSLRTTSSFSPSQCQHFSSQGLGPILWKCFSLARELFKDQTFSKFEALHFTRQGNIHFRHFIVRRAIRLKKFQRRSRNVTGTKPDRTYITVFIFLN